MFVVVAPVRRVPVPVVDIVHVVAVRQGFVTAAGSMLVMVLFRHEEIGRAHV